ncbi:MAG: hypothetical protein AAGG79_06495, partial [Pseudomonadota bacterium]
MTRTARDHFQQLTRDVRITRRGVQIRKTGYDVPMTLGTMRDTWRWMAFERALHKEQNLLAEPLRVCFTPTVAGPWYFARAIVTMLGAEIVSDPQDADLVWGFDDDTHSSAIDLPAGAMGFNTQCTDISKSFVGLISQAVFGEALTVDPATYDGPMVEKSE